MNDWVVYSHMHSGNSRSGRTINNIDCGRDLTRTDKTNKDVCVSFTLNACACFYVLQLSTLYAHKRKQLYAGRTHLRRTFLPFSENCNRADRLYVVFTFYRHIGIVPCAQIFTTTCTWRLFCTSIALTHVRVSMVPILYPEYAGLNQSQHPAWAPGAGMSM